MTDVTNEAATTAPPMQAPPPAVAFDDDKAGEDWYTFPVLLIVDLARAIFGPETASFGLECSQQAYSMWSGGNQWSAGVDFLSFFRHVAKLDLDYSKWDHYEKATIHGGPRIMHPAFCMVSDRPEILTVDAQNRAHNDTGPFCRWRDGSALYAVHGVRVPQYVVERPDLITVERVDNETNAEVRRVLIERYPGGLGQFLLDAGAEEVDRCDPDHYVKGLRGGRLLRRTVRDDEAIVMIECINSTPEPDGHFKTYFLRVPPTMTDAHEAMAWTFGMSKDEYRPAIET